MGGENALAEIRADSAQPTGPRRDGVHCLCDDVKVDFEFTGQQVEDWIPISSSQQQRWWFDIDAKHTIDWTKHVEGFEIRE